MKVKLIVACFVALTSTIIVDSLYNYSYTYSTGAPAGNTGSLGDGQTCSRTGCHFGNVPNVNGWITTNIEPNGYSPDSSYTITVTAQEAGRSKFGFQITAEDGGGNKLGDFTIINSTETQHASSNDNYVTHTLDGTSGTDQKSWTFKWNSPASGNGDVTFCAAFNAADGANGSAGDNIYNECITYQENTINPGVFENRYNQVAVSVFPNPATDFIQLSYSITEKAWVTAELYSLEGKLVQSLFSTEELPGSYKKQLPLQGFSAIKHQQANSHGIYLLKLAAGNNTTTKRVVIIQ